jgi:2-polyprenyl-3-methyl-5-hydroxy-6-metoxy-1,4-benzoquinol methylase
MKLAGILKSILRKQGFLKAPSNKNKDIFKKREELSFEYIRGIGIEIGALHSPLPVKEGVEVKYVDCQTREFSIKNFPELDASKIVNPTYIDDGFTLSSVPETSQDFVIANHVLEHSSNPVQALELWVKTLRKNGILFISVPILERNFDIGRPLTSMEHLFDDFSFCSKTQKDEFAKRNRDHYLEWITISLANIARDQGKEYTMPSQANIQEQIDYLSQVSGEIHFHTFSLNSFREFLSFFSEQIKQNIKVESVVDNTIEVIAILRKM